LSGRGLCDELITRPEESYRLWCVVVCDLETSRIGAPYIYDISHLRVKGLKSLFNTQSFISSHFSVNTTFILEIKYNIANRSKHCFQQSSFPAGLLQ